jgi:DNA repair photolyase
VRVAIPAADLGLARRIDPRAADPADQLRAVRELADERIAVKVLCSPIALGQNDGDSALRPLLEAAREAGAYDVEAYAEPLRNGSRERFLESFRRLRLEHGFPRPESGRG